MPDREALAPTLTRSDGRTPERVVSFADASVGQLFDGDILRVPRIMVDEIYVGPALLIRFVPGTHYKNGRLSLEGVGANSIEIQRVPGPQCQSGIMAQDLWFAARADTGFLRFTLTWIREQAATALGYIDKWVESIDAEHERKWSHTEQQLGGKTFRAPTTVRGRTYQKGQDDGGHLTRIEYPTGETHQVEPNGARTVLRGPGGIPADPK